MFIFFYNIETEGRWLWIHISNFSYDLLAKSRWEYWGYWELEQLFETKKWEMWIPDKTVFALQSRMGWKNVILRNFQGFLNIKWYLTMHSPSFEWPWEKANYKVRTHINLTALDHFRSFVVYWLYLPLELEGVRNRKCIF